MRKPFLMIIFIAFSLFAYLWQQNTSMRFAYKVSALQAQYDKINSENDILKAKINSIFTLEKMDKVVSEKGLLRPDEKSVICID
jgi:cell division protein FtsB